MTDEGRAVVEDLAAAFYGGNVSALYREAISRHVEELKRRPRPPKPPDEPKPSGDPRPK